MTDWAETENLRSSYHFYVCNTSKTETTILSIVIPFILYPHVWFANSHLLMAKTCYVWWLNTVQNQWRSHRFWWKEMPLFWWSLPGVLMVKCQFLMAESCGCLPERMRSEACWQVKGTPSCVARWNTWENWDKLGIFRQPQFWLNHRFHIVIVHDG